MRQTLLIIPHEWLGNPLLVSWLGLGLILAISVLSKGGGRGAWIHTLGLIGVGVLAIRWLIPQIEILGVDPQNPDGPLVPIGLAIRGYGLFLMLGILAGIGMCQWRARQIGIDREKILSLCFWLVVLGLVGARLFYVVQKWDSYASSKSLGEMLARLADMTEGGLVVYGSLFGGLVAWYCFCRWNKLSLWKVADVMAPGMMAGLALGRIGCLMNGCCFGGPCEVPGMGVSFPAGSPAYYRQLETGDLLGISMEEVPSADGSTEWDVRAVEPLSPADKHGIRAGDRIERMAIPDDVWLRAIQRDGLRLSAVERSSVLVQRSAGPLVVIPLAELPRYSLPTWPSQLYSAITAFLLCWLLWFYYPFRKRDGELMALVLILYSVARFLEEIVRVDEAGFAGTSFTVSQWISTGCFLAGLALLVAVRRERPSADRAAA